LSRAPAGNAVVTQAPTSTPTPTISSRAPGQEGGPCLLLQREGRIFSGHCMENTDLVCDTYSGTCVRPTATAPPSAPAGNAVVTQPASTPSEESAPSVKQPNSLPSFSELEKAASQRGVIVVQVSFEPKYFKYFYKNDISDAFSTVFRNPDCNFWDTFFSWFSDSQCKASESISIDEKNKQATITFDNVHRYVKRERYTLEKQTYSIEVRFRGNPILKKEGIAWDDIQDTKKIILTADEKINLDQYVRKVNFTFKESVSYHKWTDIEISLISPEYSRTNQDIFYTNRNELRLKYEINGNIYEYHGVFKVNPVNTGFALIFTNLLIDGELPKAFDLGITYGCPNETSGVVGEATQADLNIKVTDLSFVETYQPIVLTCPSD
jgi:hypothetical protein